VVVLVVVLVLGLFFSGTLLGLGLAAAQHALTAGLGGTIAAGATTTGLTLAQALEVLGCEAADDDGDVARALANSRGTAARPQPPASWLRRVGQEGGGVAGLATGIGRQDVSSKRPSGWPR